MSHDESSPSLPKAKDTRRLFFAVELSDEVRSNLAEIVGRLKKAAVFTPLQAAWVATESYHLTLYFLGELAQGKADQLASLLPDAARGIPAFELDCRHLGVFPREKPRPPRVLWAGIHNPPSQLHTLRTQCASIIARSGLPVPDQDFSPHITLARFRSTKGLNQFLSIMREYEFAKAGRCQVTRLVLMESLTGGGPARYVPYQTADLKGS